MNKREQQIADAIRKLRSHLGESQQQFSDRMKVTVRTVARWETEKAPPEEVIQKLRTMAEAEGLTGVASDLSSASFGLHMDSFIDLLDTAGGGTIKALLYLREALSETAWEQINAIIRTEIKRIRDDGTGRMSLTDLDRWKLGKLIEGIE